MNAKFVIEKADPGLVPGRCDSGGCIDFSGMKVAIDSPDPSWLTLAFSRFSKISAHEAPDLEVNYRPIGHTSPSVESLHWGRMQPIQTCTQNGVISFDHPGFFGRYSQADQRLEVEGIRATYPLDLLFMTLWYSFVPKGLILHSTLIVHEDKAFLCAGPSGSGKSTLARLLPKQARCEELAAVVVGNISTHARSLPFWEEKPGEFPLAAIHILEHGTRHKRTLQTPKQALTLLRSQIAWPIHDPAVTQMALSSFCKLITRIPVFRLAFTPDESVLPWITDVA